MSLRWRIGSVAALVLLLSYLALGNFFSEERRAEAWYLPDEGLRLGLDLQGGIHLVISPDLEAAVAQELGHIEDSLALHLEEEKISGARTFVEGDRLQVAAAGASDVTASCKNRESEREKKKPIPHRRTGFGDATKVSARGIAWTAEKSPSLCSPLSSESVPGALMML